MKQLLRILSICVLCAISTTISAQSGSTISINSKCEPQSDSLYLYQVTNDSIAHYDAETGKITYAPAYIVVTAGTTAAASDASNGQAVIGMTDTLHYFGDGVSVTAAPGSAIIGISTESGIIPLTNPITINGSTVNNVQAVLDSIVANLGGADTHMMSDNLTNATGGALLHDASSQDWGIENVQAYTLGSASNVQTSTGTTQLNASSIELQSSGGVLIEANNDETSQGTTGNADIKMVVNNFIGMQINADRSVRMPRYGSQLFTAGNLGVTNKSLLLYGNDAGNTSGYITEVALDAGGNYLDSDGTFKPFPNVTDTHLMSTNQTNATGAAILHDGNAQAFGITNIGAYTINSVTNNQTATSDINIQSTGGITNILAQEDLTLGSFTDQVRLVSPQSDVNVDAGGQVVMDIDTDSNAGSSDFLLSIQSDGLDGIVMRKDRKIRTDGYALIHRDTGAVNSLAYTMNTADNTMELSPFSCDEVVAMPQLRGSTSWSGTNVPTSVGDFVVPPTLAGKYITFAYVNATDVTQDEIDILVRVVRGGATVFTSTQVMKISSTDFISLANMSFLLEQEDLIQMFFIGVAGELYSVDNLNSNYTFSCNPGTNPTQ